MPSIDCPRLLQTEDWFICKQIIKTLFLLQIFNGDKKKKSNTQWKLGLFKNKKEKPKSGPTNKVTSKTNKTEQNRIWKP